MRIFFPIVCLPIFLSAYTLNELVEISHNNRVVKSASHLLVSKEKAYESTKGSYLPSVEIGGTYQNVLEETPALAQNSFKIQAKLKYIIYDGGKKSSLYHQLESGIDSSKNNIEAVKNSISLDVTRLYFEYIALNSDKEAINQEIEQLKAEFTRVNLFYKSGSITRDEVDKIDSRLKGAVVELQEIELESQKILHTLEYYTTQKITSIESGSSIKLQDEEKISPRADIKALENDVTSLLYEANTKKSFNLPTLYFENIFSHSDYYFSNRPAFNFLVENQNIATLNVSWNIFDFGAITNSYESKLQEYFSKQSTLEHEKHKASVDYRLAKKSLEIAKLKIESTLSTLKAATSTYELVKIRYQNGTIDNIAYLQALSEKFDAQRGYERALLDLEVKKAELIYYSGKDIKEFFR